MSLANVHTQLKAILLADAGLADWARRHFSETFTALDANRPIARIAPDDYPVFVLELGDAETGPEVSNYSQFVTDTIEVAVGWYEDDPDTAFAQHTELSSLMIKAVMGKGTLNDAATMAWVSKRAGDKSVNHPRHFVTFTVAVEYQEKNP